MRDISSLIQRFSRLLNKKQALKDAVASAVYEASGRSVSPEEIFIEGTTLEIRSAPALKSEIKMNEGQILKNLRSRGVHISRFLYK